MSGAAPIVRAVARFTISPICGAPMQNVILEIYPAAAGIASYDPWRCQPELTSLLQGADQSRRLF
jgi:hypothetical protein